MAHKTLVNGTEYEITGGMTLYEATLYSISNGVVLVDGEEYIISFGPALIVFYIETTERYAVEGMTWAEWVDSEYNVDGYYFQNNGYSYLLMTGASGSGVYEYVDGATPNGVIEEGHTYAFSFDMT